MPNSHTIERAICVARWMSSAAPVVISPKTISSAMRPPSAMAMLRESLLARHEVAIFVGEELRHAERGAARDDGDLVDLVVAHDELADQRVTRLVPGGGAPLVLAHDHRAALGAHEDLVLGHLEVGHRDGVLVLARGEERGLVDEVLEVGADEAGRAASDDLEVDVGRERHLLGVHAEDAFAAAHVGARAR